MSSMMIAIIAAGRNLTIDYNAGEAKLALIYFFCLLGLHFASVK